MKVFQRVEGIIAAAGKSIRTGAKYKMTLDLSGKTVIERSIDSMAPFCCKITVVTGFNSEKIGALLDGYGNIEIVFNENYEDGMYSSIKAGLRRVQADSFFFLPGDCPFVAPAVYEKMLERKIESNKGIIVPLFKGVPGHPVLFGKGYREKILHNSEYKNLREFIHDNNSEFLEVGHEGVLFDIDTMEDYQKALRIFRPEN